ncbi:hypothetical protein MVES1_001147 [Malassezia vespertilionis]|uniref:uncharacterized protein n=1 Tax=Malassezia vespertilionis TaxID=2020962 RepID=UPI0024B0516D|nr:uncharacterized protein MVES1_001147 [Malassezia vespertilionis]WFD05813.1 hypothetical protein MVES1_001147 [Malassezia vespertilionis]
MTLLAQSHIPDADEASLSDILYVLLQCEARDAMRLAEQSRAAMQELPGDSRPVTYDALIDVARFCVEEEPGWAVADRVALLNGCPLVDAPFSPSDPPTKRLSRLRMKYEERFPHLRFISAVPQHSATELVGELEALLQHSTGICASGSAPWLGELERTLEALWDRAVARAIELEQGKIDTSMLTPSTTQAGAAGVANGEVDMDEPFLNLAYFRAVAVSAPTLQQFFEHALPSSFKLEEVHRSTTGAAFAWHAAPVVSRSALPKAVPSTTGPEAQAGPNADGTVSFAATILHGGAASLAHDTPASYSRDITTGTRGKVVGFLGSLLGEEGKTRMDALADQVALRLQTHSVKGPLPSFAEESTGSPSKSKGNTWGAALLRGTSAAAGAIVEPGTRTGLGGRLAGAFKWSSDNADAHHKDTEQSAPTDISTHDTDAVDQGAAAALESLRVANETLAQERDTFIIDEVAPHDLSADADEEEAMSDVEAALDPLHDSVSKADSTVSEYAGPPTGQLEGLEAQRMKGMYWTQPPKILADN